MLQARELAEGTSMEREWGEYLKVPIYAYDDGFPALNLHGQCTWEATRLPFLADDIFYTAEYDTLIYKDMHSWATIGVVTKSSVIVSATGPTRVGKLYMIPLEGGGSVPHQWFRKATSNDLAINPSIHVVCLEGTSKKKIPRATICIQLSNHSSPSAQPCFL